MRKKFELGGLTKAQKTLPKKLQDLISKKKKKPEKKESAMMMAMKGKKIMANRRYNTQVTNDRACMSKGGSTSEYHTTKEGKKAKKGLWYNIAMKRKRGEKMRKKGAKGAPTEAAIKKSQA
jgi:hypothetical protein